MIEDKDLFLAKSGDEDALERIISTYKPYISRGSKNLFLMGGDPDDVVQEGIIGLLKAIRTFDFTKNVAFNTFASLCIRGQILTAIKAYDSYKHKTLNNSIRVQANTNAVIDIGSTSSNPESIYLGKEFINDVLSFSSYNLSPLEKSVFYYFVLGYSYLEIGDILNVNYKTIDNTLQRVRKKLSPFIYGL